MSVRSCLFFYPCGDQVTLLTPGDETNIRNFHAIFKSIKAFHVNYSYI